MIRPGGPLRAIIAAWLIAATLAAATLGLLSLLKEGGIAPERFLSSSHPRLSRFASPAPGEEAPRALFQPFAPPLDACDEPGS